ncbi:MAG: response regulator [Lentisphaeria bacterium]
MTQPPPKRRILVVDDQPFIAKLIEINLPREEFTVLAYRSPLAALAQADSLAPDLMILDVRMPEMTGVELCRHLRQRPHFQQTPIIILTAQGETTTENEARDAGATVFMTKPFSPRGLSAKLRELLAAAPVPGPAPQPPHGEPSTGGSDT